MNRQEAIANVFSNGSQICSEWCGGGGEFCTCGKESVEILRALGVADNEMEELMRIYE